MQMYIVTNIQRNGFPSFLKTFWDHTLNINTFVIFVLENTRPLPIDIKYNYVALFKQYFTQKPNVCIKAELLWFEANRRLQGGKGSALEV